METYIQELPYWAQFLSVLLSMIAADICWTYYFIKVDERKPIGAGLWGSIIVLFSAFITKHYVDDPTFVIAAFLGAFIGTSGTVWYKKRKDGKKQNGTKS